MRTVLVIGAGCHLRRAILLARERSLAEDRKAFDPGLAVEVAP